MCKLGLATGHGFGLDDGLDDALSIMLEDYKPELGLGFDFDLQLQQDLE